MAHDTAFALGLGANIGRPIKQIREACRLLEEGGVSGVRVSPLYETAPVDCVPGTPPFVNGALVGLWAGAATGLLDLCHHIENTLGRPADHSSQESRTIDLDLLLFDELVINGERLLLPHPLLRKRLFVLIPLRDVAPDWAIPPDGARVKDVCAELVCRAGGKVGIKRLGENGSK